MVWTISIDEWQKATGYLIDSSNRNHTDHTMMACELSLNLHGVSTCFSCCCNFPYVIIGGVEPERYQEVGQNLLQMLDMFYCERQTPDSAYGNRLVIQACGFSQYALVNIGSIVGLHDSSYLQEFIDFDVFLQDYVK
jgi:hypothetical protein